MTTGEKTGYVNRSAQFSFHAKEPLLFLKVF